jgi:hypothetical protein
MALLLCTTALQVGESRMETEHSGEHSGRLVTPHSYDLQRNSRHLVLSFLDIPDLQGNAAIGKWVDCKEFASLEP